MKNISEKITDFFPGNMDYIDDCDMEWDASIDPFHSGGYNQQDDASAIHITCDVHKNMLIASPSRTRSDNLNEVNADTSDSDDGFVDAEMGDISWDSYTPTLYHTILQNNAGHTPTKSSSTDSFHSCQSYWSVDDLEKKAVRKKYPELTSWTLNVLRRVSPLSSKSNKPDSAGETPYVQDELDDCNSLLGEDTPLFDTASLSSTTSDIELTTEDDLPLAEQLSYSCDMYSWGNDELGDFDLSSMTDLSLDDISDQTECSLTTSTLEDMIRRTVDQTPTKHYDDALDLPLNNPQRKRIVEEDLNQCGDMPTKGRTKDVRRLVHQDDCVRFNFPTLNSYIEESIDVPLNEITHFEQNALELFSYGKGSRRIISSIYFLCCFVMVFDYDEYLEEKLRRFMKNIVEIVNVLKTMIDSMWFKVPSWLKRLCLFSFTIFVVLEVVIEWRVTLFSIQAMWEITTSMSNAESNLEADMVHHQSLGFWNTLFHINPFGRV